MACGILVPQSGIEPTLPALEAQNLNHWTTQTVLESINLIQGSDVSPQAQLKEVNLNKIHVVQSPVHITASFLML